MENKNLNNLYHEINNLPIGFDEYQENSYLSSISFDEEEENLESPYNKNDFEENFFFFCNKVYNKNKFIYLNLAGPI